MLKTTRNYEWQAPFSIKSRKDDAIRDNSNVKSLSIVFRLVVEFP
jgi:hypothetical protein